VTRPVALPEDTAVDQAVADAHAAATEGTATLSVLAVATALGLSNTTFRRHFPEHVRRIQALASPDTSPRPSRPATHTADTCRQDDLRRDNADLRANLALAAANIARLTLDNHRLRAELDAVTRVRSLDPSRRH